MDSWSIIRLLCSAAMLAQMASHALHLDNGNHLSESEGEPYLCLLVLAQGHWTCELNKLILLSFLFSFFPQNYSSILTVHPEVIDGRPGTLVIESFVVDVPEGNTKDETCYFVEALLKCNLKSLAEVSERLVVKDQTEPLDRWLLPRFQELFCVANA